MKNLATARSAVAAFILATGFASALVFSPSGAAARAIVGTNIVVNSTSDAAANDGLCTLREAITSANTNAASGAAAGECTAGTGDDMITISANGTINLTSALPDLSTNVTVNGPGANLLTVRRNTGGDYRVFTVASGATVQMSGLTVSNGRTPDGRGAFGDECNGGGVFNAGTLKLAAVTVSGNQTGNGIFIDSNHAYWRGGDGGGIYNAGVLELVGATVSGNVTGSSDQFSLGGTKPTGGAGGGVFNSGTASVTNSTISGNRTGAGVIPNNTEPGDSGNGVGVANVGSANFTNSTVVSNTASSVFGDAGGINCAPLFYLPPSAATLRNSIVAGNDRGDVRGPINSGGHNLIQDARQGTFTGDTSTDITGVGPQLGPLASNGGTTETHLPLPGSPAIDAGSNALAVDPNGDALSTDQRGKARVNNGTADIGAVETAYQIAATGGTPQSATINADFASQLKATLTESGRPVQGITVTFAAPASGAGGTFSGGNTAATDAGGQASVAFRANATAGAYNVTANIIPALASPAVFSLTNGKANTTTTVTSSANPSIVGQSVTFTATVTSSAGTPTGTVQFKVDDVNLGSPVPLGAGGSAAASTSTLTAGQHTVTAVYGGDSNFSSGNGSLFTGGGQWAITLSPTLSFKSEGDEPNDMDFSVSYSPATPLPLTINYATVDGTATAPSDYVAAGGSLFFQPGQTSRLFSIRINGDTTYEDTEDFFIDFSLPGNPPAARGKGIIINDDPSGGVFEFDKSSYTVAEGGSMTVKVTRAIHTDTPADVDYATDDGSTPSVVVPCSSVTGIALDRCDYTKSLGTLHFAPGETEKTFQVFISDDAYVEGPETAHLKLMNPTGNSALGPKSTADFTITDDSPERTGNPSDDSIAFVRQHYRDFLNRDPDANGLAFWTSQIESCGADAQCREVKRVNVSAAFFLSIEFQQTGNLVYKMYKAGFGNLPGKPVAVQRTNFLGDTQQIQSTPAQVIVGQGNWQAQLETNKTAFAQEFVQRTAFQTAHGSQTVTQYVDSLFANAGVTPTDAERNAAVAAFGGGGVVGHAAALRSVADSASVTSKTLNESFVLMQYFGYLQRDPDAAPDTNFDGYNFWLSKLNQFNGNYIAAEMVKAFIASDEYRHRFGQ